MESATTALTRMADDSGELLEALERRLFRTWTMRRRSAVTKGKSGGRSVRMLSRPPPRRNMFLASSTRTATSTIPAATGSVPVSMRATSSRSPIRSRM